MHTTWSAHLVCESNRQVIARTYEHLRAQEKLKKEMQVGDLMHTVPGRGQYIQRWGGYIRVYQTEQSEGRH